MRGQDQNRPSRNEQQKVDKNEFENQFPVADFEAPLPTEPERQAERHIKSLRYKKQPAKVKEMPKVVEVTEAESWIERLPALPVAQSDAVVLGRVTKAQAFLSADKTGVYSEFNVEINEVLNNKSGLFLAPDTTLIAEREGGRVSFPSKHVQLFRLSGQGSPQVGRRYVLFLRNYEQTRDFLLLTAYELRDGWVFPIDDVSRHIAYRGLDEAGFLKVVRNAIILPVKELMKLHLEAIRNLF